MTLHDSNSAPCHPISAATPPSWITRIAPANTLRLTRAAFTNPRTLISAALARIARFIREAGTELARVNRIGLHPDALAGKSRRERARTVADALNRRHAGHRRCC
jgi:hypothetical protein